MATATIDATGMGLSIKDTNCSAGVSVQSEPRSPFPSFVEYLGVVSCQTDLLFLMLTYAATRPSGSPPPPPPPSPLLSE